MVVWEEGGWSVVIIKNNYNQNSNYTCKDVFYNNQNINKDKENLN